MKVFLRTFELALSLALIASPLVHANGANSGGGGGDSYSIQFIQIANRVSEYLVLSPENEREGVDPKSLVSAIYDVQVESVDGPLQLNGRAVDAINYPDLRKIVISRTSWNQMGIDDRRILALHEYMGILRISDERYQVSRAIVGRWNQKVGLCGDDEERFRIDTQQFFLEKKHTLEHYVGNYTRTLSGSTLYTIRGFGLDWDTDGKRAKVSALFRVGECNPHTGHFDHLQFSASGAGIAACR